MVDDADTKGQTTPYTLVAKKKAERMYFLSEDIMSEDSSSVRASVSASVDRIRIWAKLYPHLSESQVKQFASPHHGHRYVIICTL